MARTESNLGKVMELPLASLEIGTAQVRTDLASGIDDLADSIRVQGLVHPILVVNSGTSNYEIIAGQRRFLAHEKLGYKTIRAVVMEADEINDVDRVVMSLTENLVRRDCSQKELIDACTKLFKRYGSIKMVAEETGLKPADVSKYVKYDQLVPALQTLVDDAKLDMKVALQAQTAASEEDGTIDEVAASKFAVELSPMSNQQRNNFVKTVGEDPSASIEEKIERGRRQPVLKQVIVTLEQSLHKGLQSYARDEDCNQDEAAAALIEDGLARRGLLVEPT
jgi:ParB family transcriptional regulator, chromosome partitioning protein